MIWTVSVYFGDHPVHRMFQYSHIAWPLSRYWLCWNRCELCGLVTVKTLLIYAQSRGSLIKSRSHSCEFPAQNQDFICSLMFLFHSLASHHGLGRTRTLEMVDSCKAHEKQYVPKYSGTYGHSIHIFSGPQSITVFFFYHYAMERLLVSSFWDSWVC